MPPAIAARGTLVCQFDSTVGCTVHLQINIPSAAEWVDNRGQLRYYWHTSTLCVVAQPRSIKMAQKETNTIVVPFLLEKETKGTCRYAEVGADPTEHKIGTLYVKKGTLQEISPSGYPKGLSVTLRAV